VLGLNIRYGTRLVRIEPASDHLRLHLEIAGSVRIETARKVILGNVYVIPERSLRTRSKHD
jgi:FAD-dependent urate hydroxylase